jgi:acyl-homoserine lactone acylase PvdQ
VTDADLRRYFKRETLGLAPGEKAVAGRAAAPGVTITRDRWGVPHVKGTTAENVAFGAGWATAADRQLIMELLRGPGRIAALDAPGVERLRARAVRAARSGRARLRRRASRAVRPAARPGREGRQAIRIIDAYVAGINARVPRRRAAAAPWTRNDVVAVGGLIGAVFGAAAATRCAARSSSTCSSASSGRSGRRVWEDLRQRDDPEANVAVPGRRRTLALLERDRERRGRLDRRCTPAAVATATTRLPMSNALLVGAKRSTTGKPLFVAGPQVGQYYPQIMLELDLDGGGYRAAGRRSRHLVRDPARPRDRLRVERDVRRLRSRRPVRRDALRQGDTMYLYRGECRR